MRTIVAGAGLVAALAAPVVAAPPAASTGPFVGTVVQGETDSFTYDSNPSNNPCLQIAANYTVALHAVPGDTLTLTVGTQSVTTSTGAAAVNLTSGVCARFGLSVTGTAVSGTAHYVVTVTRQLLAPLS